MLSAAVRSLFSNAIERSSMNRSVPGMMIPSMGIQHGCDPTRRSHGNKGRPIKEGAGGFVISLIFPSPLGSGPPHRELFRATNLSLG